MGNSIHTILTKAGLLRQMWDLIFWDAACSRLASCLIFYPTGEDLFDAYWRTLVCNRDPDGNIPNAHFALSTECWRRMLRLYIEQHDERGEWRDHVDIRMWMIFFNFLYADIYISYGLWTRLWHQSSLAWIFAVLLWLTLNFVFLVLLFIIEMSVSIHDVQLLSALVQNSGPPEQCIFRSIAGRDFCITRNGYMGLVPLAADVGDWICAFRGCRVPFVIRAAVGGYRLIGDAYIHGMMDNETGEQEESDCDKIRLV
jgi:hypothetical protein